VTIVDACEKLASEAVANGGAEPEYRVIGDAVVDEVALAATDHEARRQQQQHLLRCVLLRRPGCLCQLGHGCFAVVKTVEEPDSRRVRERLEAAGDQLDQLVGQRVSDRRRAHPSGMGRPGAVMDA
jgi:hypothetical protein